MPRDSNGVDTNKWERVKGKPVEMTPPPTPSTINPFLRAVLPAILQLQPDLVDQKYTDAIPKIRILPFQPNANAGINATAQGIVQQVVASLPQPSIPPPVTDGLTHGDAVWEHDSAYVELRDDFLPVYSTVFGPNPLISNPIGELGWFTQPTSGGGNAAVAGGNPPYLGQVGWENNNTAGAFISMLLGNSLNIGGGLTPVQYQRNSFGLLENPGWKLTWVFKHEGTAGGPGDFQAIKKSFYIGLSGAPIQTITTPVASGGAARPDIFIGLRYDTSTIPAGMDISNSQAGGIYFGTFNGGGGNAYAGQNITFSGFTTAANNGTFLCTASSTSSLTVNNPSATSESPTGQAVAVLASIPLTAAATASGGNTIYTMVDVNTVGSGANGAYIGLSFVVTGFINAANNGTFTCVQSTATQLTLSNGSGVAETHQGFATTTSLNDSFYTFEVVQNPQYASAARHNKQGQTFVTPVAPIAGIWHRLDMTCPAAGVVVMTLDGNATQTFTVPQITYTSVAGQASWTSYIGRVGFDTVGTSGTAFAVPFSPGSAVAISGLIGGNVALNGTHVVFNTEGPSSSLRWAMSARGSIANNSTGYTAVGYPALTPVCTYGNDDTANPATGTMRSVIDFFSLVWNPKLGPSAPGSPNKTKPRYW